MKLALENLHKIYHCIVALVSIEELGSVEDALT